MRKIIVEHAYFYSISSLLKIVSNRYATLENCVEDAAPPKARDFLTGRAPQHNKISRNG